MTSVMQICAQVLVTAESLASKRQYARAEATFSELLRFGVVPIVNENVRRPLAQHSETPALRAQS
jgi:glutamate 5-kinase